MNIKFTPDRFIHFGDGEKVSMESLQRFAFDLFQAHPERHAELVKVIGLCVSKFMHESAANAN